MNTLYKEVQMGAVVHGTYNDVKNTFRKHKLVFDRSYFDYRLLIAAFKRNDRDILKYLLFEIKCRVVNPDKIKLEETPLHLAMKLNKSIIIKKLLCKGASPFDKDENGEIPILVGFKNKKYEGVRTLLTYCKPNCKADDKDFILHFHIACIRDCSDSVEHYLKRGVNPNSPFSVVLNKSNLKKKRGLRLNPVQFAAKNDYWLLFRRLLYYGGDLSVKNAKGLTPLHIIYFNKSLSIKTRKYRIKHIFEIGNDTKFVNAVDNDGLSHFHMSCMIDNPDVVQKFIEGGENVDSSTFLSCSDDSGYTPLHFAVINGCERVVELLLKNGANCNKQDRMRRTPLHLTCNTPGHYKARIIKLLLDYQANPAIKDRQDYTPLHMGFYYADSENQLVFDMLLSKITGEINFTNNEGLSHFHIACATNKINLVKDFLEAGVNIDSCVSSGKYGGYTALHFAALHNQKDVVKLLLEKNAQVNIKTEWYQATALHLACEFNYAKFCGKNDNKNIENFEPFPVNVDSISNRRNQLDIISLLLSHGAEVDAKDYHEMTPLLYTCTIDRNYCTLKWSCTSTPKRDLEKEITIRIEKVIKLLFSHKAKMNARSNSQRSILHIISSYSSLKITNKFIKSILNKGIDIDAVDYIGLTPLHVAVEAKNKRMVQILLKHNANVNFRCNNSRIPLHMLFFTVISGFENVSKEIFCALLENGSDVNIQVDEKRQTLLCHAIQMQNNFIVDKLLNYGADVNIEDPFGNTCISVLVNWVANSYGVVRLESASARVFQTIYIHVQKLLALNLHVSEKVQNHCSELYLHHKAYIKLDNIFHNCTKELEKMKLIKIYNNTSLYSIILLIQDQPELAKYVRNKNLIKLIKAENFNENFPLYSNILKAQFTRCSMKNNLLQSAKASLKYIFKASLPDLCWDVVLEHLEIKDYVNLIIVAPSKRSLKRKSSNTNLKESEPNGNKKRKIDD